MRPHKALLRLRPICSLPFINAGKAVFEVEYRGQPSKFCPKANAMKLSSIKKNLSLDAAPLIQCN
jgi:hypothetical protein